MNAFVEAEFAIPLSIRLVPAIVSIIGAFLAVFIYHFIPVASRPRTGHLFTFLSQKAYRFLMNGWFFDVIIINFVIKPTIFLGLIISKVLDRGVIEIVGPYGFTRGLNNTAHVIARYDSGLVTSYALYMVLGILVIFLYVYSNLIFDNQQDYGLILVYLSSIILLPHPSSLD